MSNIDSQGWVVYSHIYAKSDDLFPDESIGNMH